MSYLTSELTKNQTRATCVLVLGSHRSGTSALTRVFALQGCSLPKTLMAAGIGNDLGHWESEAITAFNDELLNSAGCSWDDWQAFNTDWYRSPTLAQFARRARKLLREEFGDEALFVLKDPRLCLIAPFWLRVLAEEGVKTCIVMPLRAPAEVASSLLHRDTTNVWTGRLLWLRYVLEAEAATRGHDRLVTTYSQLLDDWRALVGRASVHFDLVFPRQTPNTAREVDNFLVPKDKNRPPAHPSRRLSNDVGFDLSRWVEDVYEIFHRWAETQEDAQDHPRLDEIRERFNQVSQALGPIFSTPENRGIPGEGEVLRRDLEDLRARVQQAENGRQEAERQAHELAAARAELFAHHADAVEQIAHLNEERARLTSDLEQAQRQTQAVAAELEISQAHSQNLGAELGASREHSQRIEAELESTASHTRDLNGQLQALTGHCHHLQHAGQEKEAALAHVAQERALLIQDLEHERARAGHLNSELEARDAAFKEAADERDLFKQRIASQEAQTASFWKRLKWLAKNPRLGA